MSSVGRWIFSAAVTLLVAAPVVAPAAPGEGRGKAVFEKWCSACHAPDRRKPGTVALEAKYGQTLPAALEQRKDLSPEIVAYFVRHGVSIMPPFRKTEISDSDLKELGAYLTHPARKTR